VFKAEAQKTEIGISLKVTAQSTIRDFVLMIDKLDPQASVDSGLITLLPGESHEFIITTSKKLSTEQLIESHVLRSANQLVTVGK
jgi:beta-mannosidase